MARLYNCKSEIENWKFSIPMQLASRFGLFYRLGLAHLACALFCVVLSLSVSAQAEVFLLPTSNRAIYEPGQEEKFFVPTPGKTWMSGTFGCVRTEGWQIHEGLDIRCLQRDKHGEPIDPVMATADGTLVYINIHPTLSNYGIYMILRHQIDELEIYSLYAHLQDVRAGLRTGQSVKAGEVIAMMGRTSNTRQRIAPDRAHVHFELNFLVNERYAAWHKIALPGEHNDHGEWNGQNLLGIDPWAVLLEQRKQGDKFSFRQFVRTQPELCRVFVRHTGFPYVKRYPALIRANPLAEKEGIAGYELALTFNGVPFELTPRAASEIKTKARFQLLSVNEEEERKNPCRRLVNKRGNRWELTPHSTELLQLLTY